MTDELTPSEKKALEGLPREKMPSAGLEDSVVGAMRARGILATKKSTRAIEFTNSRVVFYFGPNIFFITSRLND